MLLRLIWFVVAIAFAGCTCAAQEAAGSDVGDRPSGLLGRDARGRRCNKGGAFCECAPLPGPKCGLLLNCVKDGDGVPRCKPELYDAGVWAARVEFQRARKERESTQ